MQAEPLTEPLLRWSDPVKELAGFIGLFLSAGAIGFRYFAIHRWGRAPESDQPFYDDAARRAALLGMTGISIAVVNAGFQVVGLAARRRVPVWTLVTHDPSTMLLVGFLAVAISGYALACADVKKGWLVAAIGVIGGSLRAGFLGKWTSLINPIHALAAGLWIGTLFVLVVAGLSALLVHETVRDRRGAIAFDMVNGFSPLALTMGVIVVVFGLITAWRHLHVLSNLWSTPYGLALIAKLVFVAMVFMLGAWNWRRQRPSLGTESAAASIRRSSAGELAMAAIVLVLTAIVVSLPAPKG